MYLVGWGEKKINSRAQVFPPGSLKSSLQNREKTEERNYALLLDENAHSQQTHPRLHFFTPPFFFFFFSLDVVCLFFFSFLLPFFLFVFFSFDLLGRLVQYFFSFFCFFFFFFFFFFLFRCYFFLWT